MVLRSLEGLVRWGSSLVCCVGDEQARLVWFCMPALQIGKCVHAWMYLALFVLVGEMRSK